MSCFYYVVQNNQLNNVINSVPRLDGTNYNEWKEHVEFYLGIHELDWGLTADKPDDLTEESTEDEKYAHAEWTKANNLCLKFLRLTTAPNIKSSVPETQTAKEYL